MPLDLDWVRRRFERLNGSSVRYDLREYSERLASVEDRGVELKCLENRDLQRLSEDLRERSRAGASEPDLAVEAFALVREVADRLLGMRPFETQVLAGLALSEGSLIEMATGEGKTLAAVMPAYLAGLSGRGVHVLTFNDYLARRDAEWMGPVYRFLGLTVAWIGEGMQAAERRSTYACDVTYVTAKEAGFDLLRAGLAREPEDLVHRPFHFAIVDEADSILIDEARVPLVLAGSGGDVESSSVATAALVRRLEPGRDWVKDEYGRNVELTDAGIHRVEETLACGNLLALDNLNRLTEINCALHAEVLLQRDVDYLVEGGRIRLIDEFTGRVVEDRHWPDGLQAALEAKEGLVRRPEGRILNSIALQRFLRLYPRLSGMTATATPAAGELHRTYGLEVAVIPSHRPSIRTDEPDHVFTHLDAKHRALVDEIERVHVTGRPILVGTASVAESEDLAGLLARGGIACQVLNARDDSREAAIIAEAGALGAVTLSTNMAGRGTDIKLGGADEASRGQILDLGGLYVIGTNRHESLRIDRQLRGRAGRQGDPGSSRFFVSLEDPLIRRYGIDELIPPRLYPAPREEPLDDPFVRHEIARAQRIIESQNSEIRSTLADYSALLEEHRQVVHQRRLEILERRSPGRLEALCPERWRAAREALGTEELAELERSIALFQLDRAWSRHLSLAADLREGIHLLKIGGDDPVVEYTRYLADCFEDMDREIEEALVETFESLEITPAGVDLAASGLAAPTSTWTYLVNDDPFREQLATALGGNAGVGVAAAAFAGPLWIASTLYQKIRRSRRARAESGPPN